MKISKNCYVGSKVLTLIQLENLANERKSVWTNYWGTKPAAVILNMPGAVISRVMKHGLYEIINVKKL